MANAQRDLNRYGDNLQKVGIGLTAGLTAPLIAFGAFAVKNFDESAKALAQVNAGLESTGRLVGFNTKQLQEHAAALQNDSLFGDDEILRDVTAQLLTFTNITGENFKKTELAALNLATRLDGDLKGASIQLGKALNDPVLGLSALAKSGIQFSEAQKITIKSMVESGDIVKAQILILDELEKQYGGSAAAAAKAGLGPFTQFKNILGDITEDFGKIILEGLTPMVEYLKEVALKFQNLSPETKKWIVILGGVAAAAGPLLALAGTILPAIGTGLALLTGPIGIVVAALAGIGVVVYKYWEPIKKTLVDIANYFIDLYNESTVFRVAVEGIIATFKNLYEVGSFIFSALGSIIQRVVDNIKNGFDNLGKFIKAILTGDVQALPGILSEGFKKGFDTVGVLVDDLKANFKTLTKNIDDNISEGINNALSKKKYALLSSSVDTKGVEDAVAASVASGLAKGAGGSGGPDLTPQVQKVGVSLDNVGIVENPLGTMAEQLEESASKIKITLRTTVEELTEFQKAGDEIALGIADAFGSMANRLVDSLKLADTGFQGFVKGLAKTVIKLISILLANSIAQAITIGTESASVFGAGAIYTLPTFIATAVAGVLGAFAAIPKFATGGIVGGSSYYGDMNLARVNSGELILSLAMQKNLAGALSRGDNTIILQPSLKYEGSAFRIMLDRTDESRNRLT